MKTLEPPPLAYTIAAEAIGDMLLRSSPEELARAAVDAAWALLHPVSRAVTREEIGLTKALIDRGYTHEEISGLMGCTIGRVQGIARAGGINSAPRGRRPEDRRPEGLEGLTEVVRQARDS